MSLARAALSDQLEREADSFFRSSAFFSTQNTDPSTKEYEATVAMVEEVEHIIRSIEDEKTAVEERVKTRDVFARIEGLEREKVGLSSILFASTLRPFFG